MTIFDSRRNPENLPWDNEKAENESQNDPRGLSRTVGREAAHKTPFLFHRSHDVRPPGDPPGDPKIVAKRVWPEKREPDKAYQMRTMRNSDF